ncbi:MAG: hypothetical protein MUE85_18580 [Microscillaceae bacterium]|jgi:microsomal dipeptidase-like Zn-dependent dipeptidase|nr:hypothetical protein [Microscillaceae bacterium]
MLADLHCHTVLHTIFKGYEDVWFDFEKPYMESGTSRFIPYMQSDFSTMAVGNIEIVVVALHPPEQKKFFNNNDGNLMGFLEMLVATIFTGFTLKQLQDFRKDSYNHYSQLMAEMDLYIKNQNIVKRIKELGKDYSFKVVKNFSDIQDIIQFNTQNKDKKQIAVVFSVEGLHCLGTGHLNFNDIHNPNNVSFNELMQRIDKLKNQAYPILHLTFTHVMHNGYCGQARALVDKFNKVLKYSNEGINQGLSENGKLLINKLLDKTSGRRILIDVKHMSLQSRLDYYAMINGRGIPIVASHMGVNGLSIQSVPQNAGKYEPQDPDIEGGKNDFNQWSINLYNEEIIIILKSKGLIGLNVDQRILGSKAKGPRKINLWGDKRWANFFFDNIRHIVQTAMADVSLSEAEKVKVWDMICVGSDYDGLINPIDGFPAANDLPDLKQQIGKILKEDANKILLQGLNPDVVLAKIFHRNILEFLRYNFN